jgi:hypothetical protein
MLLPVDKMFVYLTMSLQVHKYDRLSFTPVGGSV